MGLEEQIIKIVEKYFELADRNDCFVVELVMKTKDQAKMVELGNKGKELSAKGSEALKQAQGEDLTKLTEYMKAKTDEFVAISQGKY